MVRSIHIRIGLQKGVSRLALSILGLPALCVALNGHAGAPLALAPGDRAPEMRGNLLSSSEYQLVDYAKNKLTLVNFWATWCVPCQKEMPELQALYDRRAADGLEVIGVHSQEVSDLEIQSFVYMLGVKYPVIRTMPRIMRNWGGINALPCSFLIDAQGIILRRYVGATPEQVQALVADVEAALGGRALGPMAVPDATNAHTEPLPPQEPE